MVQINITLFSIEKKMYIPLLLNFAFFSIFNKISSLNAINQIYVFGLFVFYFIFHFVLNKLYFVFVYII